MDESSCELPTFAISTMLSLDCPAPMISEFLICSNLWISSLHLRMLKNFWLDLSMESQCLMVGWETKSRSLRPRWACRHKIVCTVVLFINNQIRRQARVLLLFINKKNEEILR